MEAVTRRMPTKWRDEVSWLLKYDYINYLPAFIIADWIDLRLPPKPRLLD